MTGWAPTPVLYFASFAEALNEVTGRSDGGNFAITNAQGRGYHLVRFRG